MKRYIISTALPLFSLLLPVISASDITRSKVIIFKTSRGDVTFKHLDHVEDKGVRCIACHHKYIKAEPASCSICHPLTKAQAFEKFSNITLVDALHKRCIDCHKLTKKGGSREQPPVACNECHIQPAGTRK
ncbi:MAG: cytochrome c3 family protein [Acidobacteriota bacterium]